MKPIKTKEANTNPSLIRNKIKDLIGNMDPLDELEQEHANEAISWINSGQEIFRLEKPDIPHKHLVSYFCLFDPNEQLILLVDHKKAQLWLPAGGHVDPGEHPTSTASRECFEELGIDAEFFLDSQPIFITSTQTVGLTAGHTDVSLWYVLKGNSKIDLKFDEGEFGAIRWFDLENIPFKKSDPHMRRFVSKMKTLLLNSFQ